MKNFDFLVLGSGIAGLSFALKVAPFGRVAIVTKKSRAESNTNYAQGGVAAVTSKEDSVEIHLRDTLQAGAGLCHEDAVRVIVTEGPARVAELISIGMQFTERENNGKRELDLGREGGHSKRRILHAKDVTGREIERALLNAVANQPNIFAATTDLTAYSFLVGPRPEVRQWVAVYPERWSRVLTVRPGITDPASIVYRDEEVILARSPDPERCYREEVLPHKLELYEDYVRSRTFLGDVAILLKTLLAVVKHQT